MSEPRKSVSKDEFGRMLKSFISTTAASKKWAIACSQAALIHFAACGDVVYIEQFLDAMPKNYLRRAAFLAWCRDHSPLTMVDGKLVKDKRPDAVEFKIEEALAVDFFDYMPEQETIFFTETDVVKVLKAAISRLSNAKHAPKTEHAKKVLDHAKDMIDGFATAEMPKAAGEPEEDTGDEPQDDTITQEDAEAAFGAPVPEPQPVEKAA